MGPRLLSRGETPRPVSNEAKPPGFNGAAASQPRRATLPAIERRLSACFNGAAASQPRKAQQRHKKTMRHSQLQWGRGFSAAESGNWQTDRVECLKLQWGRGFSAAERRTFRTTSDGLPSVLQWGRGFSAAERSSSYKLRFHKRGFNGAAASQPRRASIIPLK